MKEVIKDARNESVNNTPPPTKGVPSLANLLASEDLQNKTSEQYFEEKGLKDTLGTAGQTGKVGALPSAYKGLKSNFGFDASAYKTRELERQAYIDQSAGEVLKNMFLGGAVNFASGFLDHVGSYDISAAVDLATGNANADLSNWWFDKAQDFRDYTQDELPIFTDGDSVWQGAYWARMGQQTASTVGQISAVALEQILLSGLTASSGGTGGILQAARLSTSLANMTARSVTKSALKGMGRGFLEGYQNGVQNVAEIKQKYLDLGYSEEDASRIAGEAGVIAFRAEVLPLMAINALQYATLGRYNPFNRGGVNSGIGSVIEMGFDKALPKITNKLGKGVAGYGVNMASEAFEEGYQTFAGRIGEYSVDKKYNQNKGKTLSDYMWDTEMRDSIIAGAFMGGAFKAIGDAGRKVSSVIEGKGLERDLESFVKSVPGIMNENIKGYQEVMQNPKATPEEKLMALNKANSIGVMTALSYDAMAGKETGYETYVDQLQKDLALVNSGDVEAMKKAGIEAESVNYIKENYPNFIMEAGKIKEDFINNATNALTLDAAERMTITQANLRNLAYSGDVNAKDRELALSKDEAFQKLSSQGKERFKLQSELEALNRFEESILSPQQKERKEYLRERLQNIKETSEALASEDFLFNSLDTEKYINSYVEAVHINRASAVNLSNLGKEKNLSYQREQEISKVKERINSFIANENSTKKLLESAKKEARELGILDKDLEERINARIEETKVKKSSKNNRVVAVEPSATPTNPTAPVPPTNSETKVDISQVAPQLQNVVAKATEFSSSSNLGQEVEPEFDSPDKNPPSTGTEGFETLLSLETDQDFAGDIKALHDAVAFEMGKKPTFEEFIRVAISNLGKEKIRPAFDGLVVGWKANGWDVPNVNEVKNAVFTDIKPSFESLMSKLSGITPTSSQIPQESNNPEVIHQELEQDLSQANNQILAEIPGNLVNENLVTDDPTVVTSGVLRAGYKSVDYVTTKDGKGRVTVDDPVLIDSTDINAKALLRDDVANPGEVMNVRIPDNVNNMTITIWDEETVGGKSINFGDWVAQNNIEEGSKEYMDNVPMIAYNEAGEPLFFIHSPSWYTAYNVGFEEDLDKQRNLIIENRAKTSNLRKNIYTNKGGKIEITNKGMGKLAKIGGKYPMTSIYDQDPTAIMGYVNNDGSYTLSNGNVVSPNDTSIVSPKTPLTTGKTFVLRNGVTKGQKVVLKSGRKTIPIEVIHTMTNILRAHFYKNHPTLNKNQMVKDFAEATGIDIYAEKNQGLETVFKMLLGNSIKNYPSNVDVGELMNNEKINTYVDGVLQQVELETGTPYFYFKDFKLHFGAVRTPVGPPGREAQTRSFVVPKTEGGYSPQYIAVIEQALSDFEILLSRVSLTAAKQGFDLDQKGKKMAFINQSGTVKVSEDSYNTFLLKNLNTNVKGFNVGTADKPYYATVVQPVIEFRELEPETQFTAKKEEVVIPQEQDFNQDPISNTIWEGFKNGVVDSRTIEGLATKVSQKQELSTREQEIYNANKEVVDNFFKKEEAPTVTEPQLTLAQAKKTIAVLKKLGHNDSSPAIIMLHEAIGRMDASDSHFSLESTPFHNQEFIDNVKSDNTPVKGLTQKEVASIANYIFNTISSKIGVNKGESLKAEEANNIVKNVRTEFLSAMEKDLAETKELFSSLYNHTEDGVESDIFLDTVSEALIQSENKILAVKNNWEALVQEGIKELRKHTEIKFKDSAFEGSLEFTEIENTVKEEDAIDSNENLTDSKDQQDGNYSKTSLEENGKQTASPILRRFLANTIDVDANYQTKETFLGLPSYVSFDKAFETIQRIMSNPTEAQSSYKDMIARLEDNVEMYPWLRQVIDKLNNSDLQVKNLFVYNFAKHTLSMKFLMFSRDRAGNTSMKVYNTNSNEIRQVIRSKWDSNFKGNSPLVKTVVNDGIANYRIDKEEAKRLRQVFESFNPQTVTNKELQDWLFDFGISLSNETIEELRTKDQLYYTPEGETLKVSFLNQFTDNSKSLGLFGQLGRYVKEIQYTADIDTDFEQFPKAHPFNDMKNILKNVIDIESKYATFATTNSFRDGEKSIFGFTPTKYSTDAAYKLRTEDPSYRNILAKKPYQKHSYVLSLLSKKNPDFRNKFFVEHLGITAMKELGSKVFGNSNEVTSLNSSDIDYLALGLFQDTEQGESKSFVGKNDLFSLRMARMLFPTMSDKTQMLLLNTAVVELKDKHTAEQLAEDGSLNLSQATLEFAFTQLVLPELERIVDFNTNKKADGTNIKGYDGAASLFLQYPELNNIRVKDSEGNDVRAIQLMYENPTTYNVQWFIDNASSQVHTYLQNHIKAQAKKERELWLAKGLITDKDLAPGLDKVYLNGFNGSDSHKIEMASLDFALNNQLSHAQIQMLFIGDMALYSNMKPKNFFQDGKPYLPKEELGDSIYSTIAKDIVGTNLGKRLALLLAPGSKLANSMGAKYTQVFLKDQVSIASNTKALINLFYGKEKLAQHNKDIDTYFASEDSKVKKSIVDTLSNDMPLISAYFDIEATDAQEYTTVTEHLDILFEQGRLSETDYELLSKKIANQYATEAKGEDLKPEDMFTYEELKTVMQPIKPVHTGFYNDEANNLMRMMYIKTSSFPLIPQVTKGLELDKVRLMAEKIEKASGNRVRLSYETGNKVGSNTNAIELFDEKGNFNSSLAVDLAQLKDEDKESFLTSSLGQASLELDRDNFRIQQDVPYKSSKRLEDTISLGTQTMKLLFGNGVMDLDGFTYMGKPYTGNDLKNKYEENFVKYIAHKKNVLYKSLGLDANGNPTSVESMLKIQKMLQDEAEGRGYPKQDVDALKLNQVTKPDGTIEYQFTLPLWLSPNSNRYEALLNAIVSNKLAKIKMPGYSFIAGSEAGFKSQSDLSGINQSRIVYTDRWKGELKSSGVVQAKDGKDILNKFQVFLPHKFRGPNGKLIKFFNEDGTPNSKYVVRDEKTGALKLNMESFDKELLNVTSFRIPTSSHVSMSQVEIAGFLPPEAGDLMVVPKNLTVQKGLDFDVDKENIYQLWTYISKKGKVVALKEENVEQLVQIAKDIRAKKNVDLEEAQGLRDLIGEDIDLDDVDIIEDKFIENLRDKLMTKAMENTFVRIHSSVLSNPNKKMQQKINAVLSMDFARSQASFIDGIIQGSVENNYFSVFNSDYQAYKMGLGATGKMGIGVYSNYVVTHSMIQQAQKENREIRLRDPETDTFFEMSFGNLKSEGFLGGIDTLDGSRTIAEVLAERQNTATDNEKEQIMGRLNINSFTIGVDSIMTLLGFDKIKADSTDSNSADVSLPYLFLTQPVIREFVETMKSNSSLGALNSENLSQEALIEKFVSDKLKAIKGLPEVPDSAFVGERFIKELDEKNSTPEFQYAVLKKFLELRNYAQKMQAFQSKTNITKDGLGISFFETIDKFENLDAPLKSAEYFTNIQYLIGDFTKSSNENSKEGLLEKGYMPLGHTDYLVKPTTPVGAMYLNTITTGYQMWNKFFPYDNPSVRDTVEAIASMGEANVGSSSKKVEFKQKVFKDIKKFIVTAEGLGLYSGYAQDKRRELFIDSSNNQSLANYINKLMEMKDDPIVKEYLMENPLLARFNFDLKQTGLVSTIKFDGSRGENFDENKLYNSLIDLLAEDKVLPIARNGKAYTTRDLVSDLVAYAYLEGGIQEATQFVKYVPIALLKNLPFGAALSKWQSSAINGYDPFRGFLQTPLNAKGKPVVTNFVRQFFQHNNQYTLQIDLRKLPLASFIKNYAGQGLSKLDRMEVSETMIRDYFNKDSKFVLPHFISIKNPDIKKGLQKTILYQRVSGDTYMRIDTLGMFGMNEYVRKPNNESSYVSTILDKLPVAPTPNINGGVVTQEGSVQSNFFNLEGTTSLKDVLSNIVKDGVQKNPNIARVAEMLLQNLPNDFKINVGKNETTLRAGAKYSKTTKEITIFDHYTTKTPEAVAKDIVHETIHALTSDLVSTYIKEDGSLVDPNNTPQAIVSLLQVYNVARRTIGEQKIDVFTEKFNRAKRGEEGIQFTAEEKGIIYGVSDIHEFMTLALTEPMFQQALNIMPYMNSKDTLFDRVVKAVVGSLDYIFGTQFSKDNVAYSAIANTINIIQINKRQNTSSAQQSLNKDANILAEAKRLAEASQNSSSEARIDNEEGTSNTNDGPTEFVFSFESDFTKEDLDKLPTC